MRTSRTPVLYRRYRTASRDRAEKGFGAGHQDGDTRSFERATVYVTMSRTSSIRRLLSACSIGSNSTG